MVLFLPTAVIYSYLAFDHHAMAVSENLKLQKLYEDRNNFDESFFARLADGKKALDENIRSVSWDIRSEKDKRDDYLSLSILILIAPAVFLFLYRVAMWLWLGGDEKAQ